MLLEDALKKQAELEEAKRRVEEAAAEEVRI